MSNNHKIQLNDGHYMPRLGFGCYQLPLADIDRIIYLAVSVGYRYFDTAARYENEAEIGNALSRLDVNRADLHIVSKLWPTSFEQASRAFDHSLRALQLDYLDAYYLHWPGTDRKKRHLAWEALLRLQQDGLIKSVGVSNFTTAQLQDLIDTHSVVPAVNQVELHPWYPQNELVEWCQTRGITVAAWSPLFRGRLFGEPVLQKIAAQYGRTPSQIILAWHLHRNTVPLPKSADHVRMTENTDIFDIKLDNEHISMLNALSDGEHLGDDPDTYDGGNFTFRPF